MYKLQPACFKWAAMAAIASHHVRLALFLLRLDADHTGYVDIPHSLRRPKLLLTEDVNTIRATNNAIFNDLFWVHFAYVTLPALSSRYCVITVEAGKLRLPLVRRGSQLGSHHRLTSGYIGQAEAFDFPRFNRYRATVSHVRRR
jgi:hypothetical protein